MTLKTCLCTLFNSVDFKKKYEITVLFTTFVESGSCGAFWIFCEGYTLSSSLMHPHLLGMSSPNVKTWQTDMSSKSKVTAEDTWKNSRWKW